MQSSYLGSIAYNGKIAITWLETLFTRVPDTDEREFPGLRSDSFNGKIAVTWFKTSFTSLTVYDAAR